MVDELDATRPRCPVMFNRLWFGKGKGGENRECGHSAAECNCVPFVNLFCGHVQGSWRHGDVEDHPLCPVCRAEWKLVKLTVGWDTSFWVDRGPLSHCFNPCGHVASEMTVRYEPLH